MGYIKQKASIGLDNRIKYSKSSSNKKYYNGLASLAYYKNWYKELYPNCRDKQQVDKAKFVIDSLSRLRQVKQQTRIQYKIKYLQSKKSLTSNEKRVLNNLLKMEDKHENNKMLPM